MPFLLSLRLSVMYPSAVSVTNYMQYYNISLWYESVVLYKSVMIEVLCLSSDDDQFSLWLVLIVCSE